MNKHLVYNAILWLKLKTKKKIAISFACSNKMDTEMTGTKIQIRLTAQEKEITQFSDPFGSVSR